MDGQEYLIQVTEEEMQEGGKLAEIKYISETSLLTIPKAGYPACLIEDELIGESPAKQADGRKFLEKETFTLALICEVKPLNKMTRADFKTGKAYLRELRKKVSSNFADKWLSKPKRENIAVKGIDIGDGETDYIEIDSSPMLMIRMPVTIEFIYVN